MTPQKLAKTNTETGHQQAYFCWCALNKIYPFSIPNGGFRNKREAAKLVAEGARKGVPDVFLPYPKFGLTSIISCGLFIEFKDPSRVNHKNGGLSNDQIIWRDRLIDNDYLFFLAYSWLTAVDVTLDYLELPNNKSHYSEN